MSFFNLSFSRSLRSTLDHLHPPNIDLRWIRRHLLDQIILLSNQIHSFFIEDLYDSSTSLIKRRKHTRIHVSLFSIRLAASFVQQQFHPTRSNMKTVVLSSATASLSSSSHSTDDSLSATHLSDSIRTSSSTTSKSRFLQRMIPFRRSTTHRFHQLPTEVTPYDQYACLVHFLDDTERIFYVNVSRRIVFPRLSRTDRIDLASVFGIGSVERGVRLRRFE